MIDDQIDGHEWFDDARVLVNAGGRRSHGCEIDEQRHARKVLQQNPPHHERDLLGAHRFRLPFGERADVVLRDFLSVDIAENGFENDADADRQSRDGAEAGLLEFRERVELAVLE